MMKEAGMLLRSRKSQAGREMRIRLALDAVHAMVRSGFTFFSQVYIDTNMQKFHVPAQYACVDSMLFHLEGHAALVLLRLHQCVMEHGSPQEMHIDARVFVQSMSARSVTEMMHVFNFCKEHGYTRLVRDRYMWEEAEVPTIPMISSSGEMLGLEYWTNHGGGYGSHTSASCWHFETNLQQLEQVSVTRRVEELANAITKLKPVLRTEDEGRFSKIMASSFPPSDTFPESTQEFWSQFHSLYFRKLARGTY